MRHRRSLVVVLLASLLRCSGDERGAAVTPPAAAPVKAQVLPAARAAAVEDDALRAEYAAASEVIESYAGDRAVLDRAKAMLVALVNRDKNFAPAYAGLARIEYRGGMIRSGEYDGESLDRASKYASHALKLDPELLDAHLISAYIAMGRGDFDIARDALDAARRIDPASVAVTVGYANLAEDEGEHAETVRLAREILAKGSRPYDLVQAHQLMVTAYRREGHLDQADAEDREILKLSPKSAWAHGNYASFLLRRDDIDGAIREAEAAVAIVPYPIAVNVLARALIARAEREWNESRETDAGRTLERVAGLGEADPFIYGALGAFYERAAVRTRDRSMRTRALEFYEKALELEPADGELLRAVERMKRPPV